MPVAGFDPASQQSERPQTLVLDRSDIGTGTITHILTNNF